MDTKQKYIRLRQFDEIVIFPMVLEHSTFKYMDIVSAGFCHINKREVTCFGNSFSLNIESKEEDTKIANRMTRYESVDIVEINVNFIIFEAIEGIKLTKKNRKILGDIINDSM